MMMMMLRRRMTVRWFWRPGALQEHRVEAKDDREQEGDDSSDDEIDVSPVEAGRHEIFRTECKDTHNHTKSVRSLKGVTQDPEKRLHDGRCRSISAR